ncbi:Acid sphingomyelinase-like phosphodiesterase 3b [Eumeta japonica]|uniref:Acid sphingomyelinase-like phosphodiesterase 3b n=1 Tax=Eumeta variegata TaxID=151549 RepID=A0A4C1ZHS7_EUMVA|nr:Acid sphingomyelinase-like phosphodiesterase 3b [Eumeta japonica]
MHDSGPLNEIFAIPSAVLDEKSSLRVSSGCRHTRGDHGQQRGRHRGEHTCDSSWALIQSAAAAMGERHPDTLEFVLWTGDFLSSSMENLSENFKLEAVRNVTELLGRTFSSQFVFPALGHNDPPPSKRLVEMWMQWLPTEALQTFETGQCALNYLKICSNVQKTIDIEISIRIERTASIERDRDREQLLLRESSQGGYYTIEQSHSKLRIVVLNSVLWAGGAARTDGPHKAHAQWDWLEYVLGKARQRREMVLQDSYLYL